MFIERFSSYLKFEKRFSAHTLSAYLNDLSQFDHFLSTHRQDLSSASHQMVRSWMVELMDSGLNPRSINRKLSSVRKFYKFLEREKLIGSNPTSLVKSAKTADRLPVVVSPQKLNILLDNPASFSADFEGKRDKLVLELLFGTGIRVSELLYLRESDINFYEQTLRVLGKRNKERIIPLNTGLLREIKEYLHEKSEQDFGNFSGRLIVKTDGKDVYPGLIYMIVKKYLGLITTNPKRSPHVLRHSFATSLLDNGADLNAIKELLGHASLAATQVYTHNSVEKLKLIYKQAHPRA